MQRVLSFHMYHSSNMGSEFISKRMCCSFIFITTFLSVLGGFLLGRFTTERAVIIQQSQLEMARRMEDRRSDLVSKLLSAANNFTAHSSRLYPTPAYSTFPDRLLGILECRNFSLPDADLFRQDMPTHARNILGLHITALTNCLNNASSFMTQELFSN